MATRIHRGRRGFGAGQRRKLTWATHSATHTNQSTAGTMDDLLADYRSAGGSTQGCTVIRTHIDVIVQTTTPGVADGIFLGLIVANTNETAADYGPTEGFLDWALYRHLFTAKYGQGFAGYSIDLRAKRKIQELQESWFCNTAALLGVNATSVSYTARTLLALP